MNYLKKGNFWSPEENRNFEKQKRKMLEKYLVTIGEDEQKKSKEETI